MISKILAVATFVAVAQAGVFDLGHHGHATSYSSVSRHESGHDSPYVHHAAAPVAHVSHVSHVSHAPVAHYSHAAPVAHYSHAAPVAHYSHAAPVAHYAHAAPVAHYSHAAPVAHIAHAAPVLKAVHHEVYADAHPHYSYEYGVKDAHTGDDKNAHEERDGDVVKGVYSLVQPDGTTRTVHYTADDHNGFNAQVEYTGHAAHPQVVHKAVVAKTVVAAPVYHSYHH